MARIFISHSTKEWAAGEGKCRTSARTIRDLLADGFDASGHQTMLDQRGLKPGDDWSAKLHRWLGQCDGAVLIVDAKALSSPWLRKEALILSWRRSQLENFRLVTVLVGDLTTSVVKSAGLEDLVKYQTIRAQPGNELAVVADTVARFEGLKTIADKSPMANWIGIAAAQLKEAADGLIEDMADCLGLNRADREAYDDKKVTIAFALLHTTPEIAETALYELLGGISPTAFSSLVQQVKPVCVEAIAGAALHRLISDPPRRAAVINTASSGVGWVYLERARLHTQPRAYGVAIDGVAGEGGDVEIDDALRETLLDGAAQNKNMPSHYRTMQLQEQDPRLDKYYNDPKRFFMLIGRSANKSILDRLESRMEAATFLLLPGFEEAPACATATGASIVQPALGKDAHNNLLDALTTLDNLQLG